MCSAFRSANGFVLTIHQNQKQSTVDQEISSLTERLVAASGDLTLAEARIGQIAATPAVASLQGTTDMINSPVLVRLREREAEAKLALARLENSFAPQSPGFNAAKQEVATVQSLITAEVKRIRDALEADRSAAAQRVTLLKASLKDAEARKLSLDAVQGELLGREMVANSKRSIYDAVLNRYNVLLTEQQYQIADAMIVAAAFVPTQSVYPKTTLFLLIGLLVSLGFGAFLALIFERSKQAPSDLPTTGVAPDVTTPSERKLRAAKRA